MMEDLQHPLDMTLADAVDRLLHLWDALHELERRRDEASGAARASYDEAVVLLRNAWLMARRDGEGRL